MNVQVFLVHPGDPAGPGDDRLQASSADERCVASSRAVVFAVSRRQVHQGPLRPDVGADKDELTGAFRSATPCSSSWTSRHRSPRRWRADEGDDRPRHDGGDEGDRGDRDHGPRDARPMTAPATAPELLQRAGRYEIGTVTRETEWRPENSAAEREADRLQGPRRALKCRDETRCRAASWREVALPAAACCRRRSARASWRCAYADSASRGAGAMDTSSDPGTRPRQHRRSRQSRSPASAPQPAAGKSRATLATPCAGAKQRRAELRGKLARGSRTEERLQDYRLVCAEVAAGQAVRIGRHRRAIPAQACGELQRGHGGDAPAPSSTLHAVGEHVVNLHLHADIDVPLNVSIVAEEWSAGSSFCQS